MITGEQEHERLLAIGFDEDVCAFVATLKTHLRHGAMAPHSGDLAPLIGRPAESLAATLRAWV